MRYVLAIVLACGLPYATALALTGSGAKHVLKGHSIVEAAKHNGLPRHRRGRAALGGIHPLVGSGNY